MAKKPKKKNGKAKAPDKYTVGVGINALADQHAKFFAELGAKLVREEGCKFGLWAVPTGGDSANQEIWVPKDIPMTLRTFFAVLGDQAYKAGRVRGREDGAQLMNQGANELRDNTTWA